jgi:HEAT repeat protein
VKADIVLALSIQFAQVGDDEEAEKLLHRLDTHKEENVKNHVACLLSKLKTITSHDIILITDVSFNTEERLEDIDKEDSKWILVFHPIHFCCMLSIG